MWDDVWNQINDVLSFDDDTMTTTIGGGCIIEDNTQNSIHTSLSLMKHQNDNSTGDDDDDMNLNNNNNFPFNNADIFTLIENRQWNIILHIMKTKPPHEAYIPTTTTTTTMSGTKKKKNLAIHEVCKYQPPISIIDCLLDMNPNSIYDTGEYGYLPLHYACMFDAPCNVIIKLLTSYPDAVRTTSSDDTNRMLPIHLACKYGSNEDIIMALLVEYPESIHISDGTDQTPLQYAMNLKKSKSKSNNNDENVSSSSTTTRSSNNRRINSILMILKQGPTLCQLIKSRSNDIDECKKVIVDKHNEEIDLLKKSHRDHVRDVEIKYKEQINNLNNNIQSLCTDVACEKDDNDNLRQEISLLQRELQLTKEKADRSGAMANMLSDLSFV